MPAKEYVDMKLPAIQPYPFIAFWLDNQSERKTRALLWKNIKAYRTSKEGGKRMQMHILNAGEHSVTFSTIVLANIMFTQKNNSFSRINREPATLGSRLVCQGCMRWSWGGLSRNEFWVAKLNQVIWGNRASFGYSGVPFSSGLDLWLFFLDIIFCLSSESNAEMIPRHDVPSNAIQVFHWMYRAGLRDRGLKVLYRKEKT